MLSLTNGCFLKITKLNAYTDYGMNVFKQNLTAKNHEWQMSTI